MNLRSLVPALLAGLISFSAAAAQYGCPDLASAAQVNACPTEEELKKEHGRDVIPPNDGSKG